MTPVGGEAAALPSWQAGVVFSLGAGIYEELLFRLIAIALLHGLLVDVLAMPQQYGAPTVVVLSAIAFALYHFDQFSAMQWTPADWGRFAFYTLAGVYFAAIYMLRGFGIVAGAHAVYDILWVGLAVYWHEGVM
jgi:membrane protease YdiL (CAAX protease family)